MVGLIAPRGLSVIGVLVVLAGCGGSGDGPAAPAAPRRVDCTAADASALSTFVVDPFRRDLAIDTPKRIAEHLDGTPELICRTLTSDRYGELTPIAYAAGHRPDAHLVFEMLRERGADPADALPVAVWRGDSRVVPWLLDHDVDPDTGAALVLAARQRDIRMVQRLLRAGADPDRTVTSGRWIDDDGRTALHHAVYDGGREMIVALLDAGATIDAVDHAGRTPLAVAVERGDAGTIRLLFERGAAPTRMRFDEIEQLRRVATRHRMREILQFLD